MDRTTATISTLAFLLVVLGPTSAMAQDDGSQVAPDADAHASEGEKQSNAARKKDAPGDDERAEESRVAELEARLERVERLLASSEQKKASGKDKTSMKPAPSKSRETPIEQEQSAIERRALMDQYIDREFRNQTEVRTQHIRDRSDAHIVDKIEEMMNGYVDLAGYFRAGYGRNGQGGSQVDFQAPGAMSKYRLGNEANNFAEIVFGKNIYIPGLYDSDSSDRAKGAPTGPIARVQFRMDFFNTYNDYSVGSFTAVGLPEAWASIGNVIKSQPTAKFWAGNRYYRRQDIHLNDFFFWNMSGGGGGIEDIQIGKAKMAIAWIGVGSTSGVSDVPLPDPENAAGFSKTNFDLRFYEVPVFSGKAEIGVIYSRARSGNDADGNQAENTGGVSFNLVHKISNFISDDGSQRFTLQFGTGAAKTFNSTFERISTPAGQFIRPDHPDSWRFRVMDDFTANIGEHFSFGPVLIYQATDFGEGDGLHQWFSAGLRPIAHFNRYFSLALEGGFDWVKDDGLETSGMLYKLTVAPQISLGNRFFSRPALRAYFTYSGWSDDFVGQVAGGDYTEQNHGYNAGMQMETWF